MASSCATSPSIRPGATKHRGEVEGCPETRVHDVPRHHKGGGGGIRTPEGLNSPTGLANGVPIAPLAPMRRVRRISQRRIGARRKAYLEHMFARPHNLSCWRDPQREPAKT